MWYYVSCEWVWLLAFIRIILNLEGISGMGYYYGGDFFPFSNRKDINRTHINTHCGLLSFLFRKLQYAKNKLKCSVIQSIPHLSEIECQLLGKYRTLSSLSCLGNVWQVLDYSHFTSKSEGSLPYPAELFMHDQSLKKSRWLVKWPFLSGNFLFFVQSALIPNPPWLFNAITTGNEGAIANKQNIVW